MNIKFIIVFVCSLLCKAGWGSIKDLVLESPSSGLQVHVFQKEGNGCFYSVFLDKKQVLLPSALGITVSGKSLLDPSAPVTLLGSRAVIEPLSLLKNHFRTQNVLYKKYRVGIGRQVIEFAVFDQGCAFRYQLPKGTQRITGEQTEFVLNGDERVWFFERTNAWKLKSYAGLWMQTRWDSLDRISPGGPVQGKPVVVQLKQGGYLFIAEAGLYDFSGMRLTAKQNGLSVNFTEGTQGFTVNHKAAAYTPWRVIGIAADLNTLVHQPMIAALNEPPDPSLYPETDYIKPGKAAWSWISRDARYLDPESEERIIDAAAELNYQYTLIDDGWETRWQPKWDVLKELVDYAKAAKMGVWVWKDSKQLKDTLYRNRFLDTLHRLGVAGIKLDFMNSEAKKLIDFEIDFLKAAARRRLMVNFHGCHASTGEYRSFPNELTREGIRGMELNIMNEPIPAWHNAALPFTRFITGPADYTPAFFSNRGATTLTHQLALLYLYDSPLQCIAENPIKLLNDNRYKPVLPLLKQLRTTWDSTLVLTGSKIGACAIIARKDGHDWYVAGINGLTEKNEQLLDLSFLQRFSDYSATLITDGDSCFNREFVRPEQLHKKRIALLPAGGFVLYLRRTARGRAAAFHRGDQNYNIVENKK
ncbi:glycoside hydrolase family 97 protein [Niabella aurantiaca]|uniref:glycoside hydrolase family 97 protein n=1 Tax=Niabella aurantiaca TaxID=379900 RepID=UPI00036FFC3E|nr:glycoside hydrolase family 97 protein [Niabella aurantiaca]